MAIGCYLEGCMSTPLKEEGNRLQTYITLVIYIEEQRPMDLAMKETIDSRKKIWTREEEYL
jgi:hypothetical protein